MCIKNDVFHVIFISHRVAWSYVPYQIGNISARNIQTDGDTFSLPERCSNACIFLETNENIKSGLKMTIPEVSLLQDQAKSFCLLSALDFRWNIRMKPLTASVISFCSFLFVIYGGPKWTWNHYFLTKPWLLVVLASLLTRLAFYCSLM